VIQLARDTITAKLRCQAGEEATMNTLNISKAISLTALIALTTGVFAEPEFDLGKRDFEANCAICHGTSGKGDGAFGDLLILTIPDLTTLALRNGGEFPVARIYGVIDGRAELRAHGPRQMPIWGNYYTMMPSHGTDDYPYNAEAYVRSRIVALIDYLNRIQGR
jgi:mono/diheme cytochrome c family protein